MPAEARPFGMIADLGPLHVSWTGVVDGARVCLLTPGVLTDESVRRTAVETVRATPGGYNCCADCPGCPLAR